MSMRIYKPVLASAARTADPTTVVLDVPPQTVAALFIVEVTAVTATPSIVVNIDGVIPESGNTYTLLDSAAITATGITRLQIGNGIVEAANLGNDEVLPIQLSIDVAHGDTDSITYSIDAIFV